MIPIGDDNPTLRRPVVTYVILGLIAGVWILVQGAGFQMEAFLSSICNYGLIAGEITGAARIGEGVQLAQGAMCVVDDDPVNVLTPVTSMFLHGSWMHLIGNALFLWVFGNNVEDSMGRLRFPIFYVVCGLVAAGAQILVNREAIVPMVGASGAISGVLGAYLVLYPRVRVHMFFFYTVWTMPAYLVLLWWIALQLFSGVGQLGSGGAEAGVAFWAHIGGFVAGVVLVKPFENRKLVAQRERVRHRLHPRHP